MRTYYAESPSRENRLLSMLSIAERRRIESLLRPADLEVRRRLITMGEPIGALWFPRDCVLSGVATLPEGCDVEIALMGNESVAGAGLVNGRWPSPMSVSVHTAGRAWVMSASDVQEHVVETRGELYRLLVRYGTALLGYVAHTAACNASHSIEQRLSRWLLVAHDRIGRDQFSLTHDFVAMMIGVRRASVSEIAKALRDAGAIDYAYGQMHITDRALLATKSCACYAAARRMLEETFAEPAPAAPDVAQSVRSDENGQSPERTDSARSS